MDAKKAAHGVFLARRTFGQCAAELHASKAAGWRNAKHASQWRHTLETHANALWAMPVDEVDTAACLSVLKPFWQTIPETASRVRGRIEAVLDYAKAHGLRSGENPAAWRGHLALILPKHGKLGRSHFAAMRYDDVPGFLAALHKHESVASMALELTILTAARVGEVLNARWDEIDFGSRVWTIPASRMKAGVAHRIPLSAPAVLILNRMASVRTNEFVFAGQSRGLPVNAMSRLLAAAGASGVTVHGFRSSFRDWAGEETNFPREICEAALAHATGSAVEQAYRRGDALEKRRGLMAAWATFLGRADNVVNLASANAHV